MQFSDKYDEDGFVTKFKTEKRPAVYSYSVYFPSVVDDSTASYAYIYLEDNKETVITTQSSVEVAYDLDETANFSHKLIELTVQDKYKNGVVIHVHYEPNKKNDLLFNCGPMRRYKLNQLVEKEL